LGPTVLSFASQEGPLQELRQLLVDGMYPALTWIPFLLAGIIIGRSILNYKFAARVSATAGADRLRHQQGFTSLVLTGLALLERYAAPLLAPFKTMGKTPLTYYVAHVVGFLVLMITETTAPSLVLCLVFFIVIPMVFAVMWFHFCATAR